MLTASRALAAKRLLIVEDEAVLAADLRCSLRDMGFDVVGVVARAEQALAQATRLAPDLVLMDVQLQGKPAGFRAAQQIRSQCHIPVVFLTGHSTQETVQLARAAGAYSVLTKPFRAGELDAALRIAFEQHRAEQHSSRALGQSQDQLLDLTGRLITAQEDERRRLARELHDDLGQRVALMAWRVAEITKVVDLLPTAAQQEVTALQQELTQLSVSLREVSHQLHPSVLTELGLEAALQAVAEQHRSQGSDITFVARDVPARLPPEIATALYRIAQEALRNAQQHAPGAPVLMTLATVDGHLHLTVKDPGPGFDRQAIAANPGLGLLSIQERARLIGALLEIRSAPNAGTTIAVRVPFAGEPATRKLLRAAGHHRSTAQLPSS